MIKRCMAHRINWKEFPNGGNQLNFKWQPVSSGANNENFYQTPNKEVFNHIENHPQISNKMNLFINLMKYCERESLELFKFFPFTIIVYYDNVSYMGQIENFSFLFNNINTFLCDFNLNASISNKKISYRKFSSLFSFNFPNEKLGYKTSIMIDSGHYDGKNIWLLKAPDLNRGRCIRIVNNLQEILKLIKKFNEGIMRDFKEGEDDNTENGNIYQKVTLNRKNNKKYNTVNYLDLLKEDDKKRSETEKENFGYNGKKYRTSVLLLQKYIEKPLLYNGRKFDIRVWVMISHNYDIYVFKEGHLKTTSVQYTKENNDCYVHLTNYSVQKYNDNFSKYEYGNEVSLTNFQTFLDNNHKDRNINDIWKRIIEIIIISGKAVKDKLYNPTKKYNFEIFGYDFIMDSSFNIYLLEINTNPGLEESSPLIQILVPRMIDDALRLTIDKIFDTKYSCLVEGSFSSLFPIDKYSDKDNLWELISNINEKEKKNRK